MLKQISSAASSQIHQTPFTETVTLSQSKIKLTKTMLVHLPTVPTITNSGLAQIMVLDMKTLGEVRTSENQQGKSQNIFLSNTED